MLVDALPNVYLGKVFCAVMGVHHSGLIISLTKLKLPIFLGYCYIQKYVDINFNNSCGVLYLYTFIQVLIELSGESKLHGIVQAFSKNFRWVIRINI